MIEYFDISQSVNSSSSVFPGDQPFNRILSHSFHLGNHLELSAVLTTLHIGTHADAPSHYDRAGSSIEARPLDFYLGPCQVIQVTSLEPGARIYPENLPKGLTIHTPRVLFCTNSFKDPQQWSEDFCSLSPELVHYLAEKNVMLVGIDTPSIDPAVSQKLESHQAVAYHNMAILEGLILSHVPPQSYTLVALPLKWEGLEASPVRAILIK
ncbi:MAG: cyclase family protein [Bdellovibrionales bacterium]|nr:cyclase family protein [Bdellovibrionales bacterium]